MIYKNSQNKIDFKKYQEIEIKDLEDLKHSLMLLQTSLNELNNSFDWDDLFKRDAVLALTIHSVLVDWDTLCLFDLQNKE